MKEQIQNYARKHIKGVRYLKVTLGHRGLTFLASPCITTYVIRTAPKVLSVMDVNTLG
jgi:hypothetical protein